MMDGEEIRFCFKCEVSFSSFEDLSEHSCNALNSDAIDKKTEKNHDVSKNEFDANMSPVESKPVTTFKKLYECHRKKFPKVRVSNSNMEFKKTAAICLQELLGMNDQDIFENKKFWNRINNYVTRFPKMYKKHH